MPTRSEDVCSACEVQESCDMNVDNIVECAHSVIRELLTPKGDRRFVATANILRGDVVKIGVGRENSKGGYIAVKLELYPVSGAFALEEVDE
jgi:hypothetical protein